MQHSWQTVARQMHASLINNKLHTLANLYYYYPSSSIIN